MMPQRQHALYSTPRMLRIGDAAVLIRFGDVIDPTANASALTLMATLDSAPPLGLRDLVPAYASLLVIFDPLQTTATALQHRLREHLQHLQTGATASSDRLIQIPVVYGGETGPDLEAVAEMLGKSSAETIAWHTATTYRVYFLGFIAGFPYLGELADGVDVPRLSRPRTHVAAGSVGVAGTQTGIYPRASPGGWRILGQTPQRLFDPARFPPSLLQPGDRVQFMPITPLEAATWQTDDTAQPAPSPMPSPAMATIPWLRVVTPGLFTTIQDCGRQGYARYGVSASGAADVEALLVGSALLGNSPDAAALELTLSGGEFEILAPCVIALTGAPCRADADGRIVQFGAATTLEAGARLTLEPLGTGARAYLHVTGGIASDLTLGSRATDVRAALGGLAGRPLAAGDVLWRGHTSHASARLRLARTWQRWTPADSTWLVRVLPCERDATFTALIEGSYRVAPQSDRMGVRLQRTQDASLHGGQILSEGVPRGAIQLPPDGDPIILLADHQTTGGYLVPAVVITADQWMVAQMKPGDVVRFSETTQREARTTWREQHARMMQVAQSAPAPFDIATLMHGFAENYDEDDEKQQADVETARSLNARER